MGSASLRLFLKLCWQITPLGFEQKQIAEDGVRASMIRPTRYSQIVALRNAFGKQNVLLADPDALEAFRFANRAMADQRMKHLLSKDVVVLKLLCLK